MRRELRLKSPPWRRSARLMDLVCRSAPRTCCLRAWQAPWLPIIPAFSSARCATWHWLGCLPFPSRWFYRDRYSGYSVGFSRRIVTRPCNQPGAHLFRRLDQFRVNGDSNFVSHCAGQGAHTELLAADFGCCRRAHALSFAHWIFDWSRRSIHVEYNFFSHAVNRQIAGDLQFSRAGRFCLLRAKSDGRIFLHIEKASTA